MKERPILFSGSMVRAILSGDKTQTRRVVGHDAFAICSDDEWSARKAHPDMPNPKFKFFDKAGRAFALKCPYGEPGDRLWVRETFAHFFAGQSPEACMYLADAGTNRFMTAKDETDAKEKWTGFWKPSIHMPRWASRITLEITGVRVERLEVMSRKDAIAEGMDNKGPLNDYGTGAIERDSFAKLWDSINAKKHPWSSNPWVWVIEFRQVTA